MPRKSKLAGAPIEERTFAVETRSKPDGSGLGFVGHAAVFNERTAIGDPYSWGFYEECLPGAFDKTLAERSDVYLCQDHDPGKILARVSNGTLRLAVDERGLGTDADMADVSYARDLAVLIERRDVAGMSFRFQVVQDEWRIDKEIDPATGLPCDVEVRSLKEVRLIDVTVTAIPAYPGTDASMRSAVTAAVESRKLRGGPVATAARVATARAVGERVRDELRVGKTLSTDTLSTLQDVLDLIAAADEAVDEAQPLLAALMGVDNPDADSDQEGDDGDRSTSEPTAQATRDPHGDNRAGHSHSGSAEYLRARMRAFASIHGLELPKALTPQEGITSE